MKLFLDYLNKIKLQILLMLFPTILTGMIFLLYQLPMGTHSVHCGPLDSDRAWYVCFRLS